MATGRSITEISSSLGELQTGDKALLETANGDKVEFNLSIHIAPDTLQELLVEKTITNTEEMILKVKKPDFLGDSRWEFIHDHVLEAKVLDLPWLSQFRNGDFVLLPGSAIRASVQVDVGYGYEYEVVSRAVSILKVHEVINPPSHEQRLLLPPS